MPAAAQRREVYILKDNPAIARRAAEEFVKLAQSAVQASRIFLGSVVWRLDAKITLFFVGH